MFISSSSDDMYYLLVTRGPADLLVDTGQGLNAPKAQVRGHVTRRHQNNEISALNHTILSGAQTAEELVPQIQVWKK